MVIAQKAKQYFAVSLLAFVCRVHAYEREKYKSNACVLFNQLIAACKFTENCELFNVLTLIYLVDEMKNTTKFEEIS